MKTTVDLSITALKSRFAVEYGGTIAFEAACQDGTIAAMVQQCADALYNGDLSPVLAQLARNISSYRCNARKRTVTNSTHRNVDAMVELFDQVLAELTPEKAASKAGNPGGKAAHELTPEDIFEINDLETLRKRYNSLVDYKCKHLSYAVETDAVKAKTAQINAAIEAIKVRRAELKAAEQAKPQVSDDLVAKLTKGGSATLSAAQLAELRKILGIEG